MSYQSVDRLQCTLSDTVFKYAADRKKAAGRALGTLVEVITFYMLKGWGLRDNIAIERPLPEYANAGVSHNVEYSIHPIINRIVIPFRSYALPLTSVKLTKLLIEEIPELGTLAIKATRVLSADGILRNACVISESSIGPFVVSIDERSETELALSIALLHKQPFAIVECKRVGVEEGMKKGPQTIEKAKQGAYVARSVSSLQKIRLRDGSMAGVIHLEDGSLHHGPYDEMLRRIINSTDVNLLSQFILTIGVVSNHGNWFTAKNQNKELKVLSQSYDWLLFLTDRGLAEFIDELLINPTPELIAAKNAFLTSYSGTKGRNRFTKVQMDVEADKVLQLYFKRHNKRVQSWFNVIAPSNGSLSKLKRELQSLHVKNWKKIYRL